MKVNPTYSGGRWDTRRSATRTNVAKTKKKKKKAKVKKRKRERRLKKGLKGG